MSSPDLPAQPTIRSAHAGDEPFLLEMLFYAAHAHEEPGVRPEHLLANPALARYVSGFGSAGGAGGAGDMGVVAESSEGAVGAAWVRVLAGENRGYGWVDDAIPELAIAVRPASVAGSVGTLLLRELLAAARGRFPGVSLSVRADNPARRLYVRFGFEPVTCVTNRVGGTSETMVVRFGR